ncbi:hypothetical protein CROQUDRAFT_59882 [Cronartium quercuum f. sp. fusiforme G11]|uniref:CCZ1/INTU/HSP4 first Longin domain-containing protein n=1 Tax=Cronartium quercuum f. sp. fusiforme G11 TaxID=708437 RepID=A0A9P6NRN2_9BASI|nr:hypothetical protein CROQUDRAFT_59882 [Cronartium quercuum f. sp. fusiforme G11]
MSGVIRFPFPTLVSFIIWSDKVHQPIQEEDRGSEVDEDESPNSNKNKSTLNSIPTSVLFYSDRTSNLTIEKRNRQIGLIQGLVDFSTVLGFNFNNYKSSNQSQFDGQSMETLHKSLHESSLRVVHSSNHKLLYYEPEVGFHICAMISVPPSAEKPTNPSLKIPTISLSSQGKSASSHAPSDITLLTAMKFGYLEYRLLNGSMSRYTTCRKKLVDALEKFWSVWLWRWDIQRSGCGGVDFDQLLGSHQINQQDINSLARYLLTLLSGSEAETASQRPTPANPSPPLNMLSSLAIRSIDGIQEVSIKGLEESSKWAHRAFSWASASFTNSLSPDVNAETVEILDEQLRTEMGLSPLPLARLNIPKKSAVSAPLLVETSTADQIQLQPSRSKEGSSTSRADVVQDATPPQNYPENLMNLYPSLTNEINNNHYPHNLLNLYPVQTLKPTRSYLKFEKRTSFYQSNSGKAQAIEVRSSSAQNLPRLLSSLDPRSPLYNVEFALADAMSEKSSASNNITPIEAFVQHRMLSSESTSGVIDDQTTIKQLSIFVGNGKTTADVIWLQREYWTLAIITPPVKQDDLTSASSRRSLLTESIRLLKRLHAQWPKLPSTTRNNEVMRTGLSNHRFLIQLKNNDLFYKQSSTQSNWLSKNELWSGKQTNEKEAEICLGILECLKDQPTEIFPIKETFIRTETGQWIINKKIPKNNISSSTTEIDAILVLPTGSGTLIEADNEMRKLERVSEQVDFMTWK